MDSNKIDKEIGLNIGIAREDINETQQQLADHLGVRREIVAFWESHKRVPTAGQIKKIADHCGVSADFLLGRTKTKTAKASVRAICDYTGLNEEAVEVLHLISRSVTAESKRTTHFINVALSDMNLKAAKRFEEGFPIETLFSYMDQYLTANSVKLSNQLQEDESKRHQIIFESSNSLSEISTVEDVYEQYKMNQIRRGLDTLRERIDKADDRPRRHTVSNKAK